MSGYEQALNEAVRSLGTTPRGHDETLSEFSHRVQLVARRRNRKLLRSLRRELSGYLDESMGPSNLV